MSSLPPPQPPNTTYFIGCDPAEEYRPLNIVSNLLALMILVAVVSFLAGYFMGAYKYRVVPPKVITKVERIYLRPSFTEKMRECRAEDELVLKQIHGSYWTILAKAKR